LPGQEDQRDVLHVRRDQNLAQPLCRRAVLQRSDTVARGVQLRGFARDVQRIEQSLHQREIGAPIP